MNSDTDTDLAFAHRARGGSASVPADTPTVFADMICADPQLLRVEFEELISANFPSREHRVTRRGPRRLVCARIEQRRSGVPEGVALAIRHPGPFSVGGWQCGARERGPPAQLVTGDHRPGPARSARVVGRAGPAPIEGGRRW